jgi:hypothetical protein
MLSVTCATLPPIFSPDRKWSSTVFPALLLKKSDDRGVRLQGRLFLSEHTATSGRRNNGYEKKRMLVS